MVTCLVKDLAFPGSYKLSHGYTQLQKKNHEIINVTDDHIIIAIDALETASEQDKEKIIAVLNALRSPVVNPGLEFVVPSAGSSSPRESDGYPVSSDTASLASSATAEEEHSKEKAQSQEANVPKTISYSQTHAQRRTRGSISSLEKLKVKIEEKFSLIYR